MSIPVIDDIEIIDITTSPGSNNNNLGFISSILADIIEIKDDLNITQNQYNQNKNKIDQLSSDSVQNKNKIDQLSSDNVQNKNKIDQLSSDNVQNKNKIDCIEARLLHLSCRSTVDEYCNNKLDTLCERQNSCDKKIDKCLKSFCNKEDIDNHYKAMIEQKMCLEISLLKNSLVNMIECKLRKLYLRPEDINSINHKLCTLTKNVSQLGTNDQIFQSWAAEQEVKIKVLEDWRLS